VQLPEGQTTASKPPNTSRNRRASGSAAAGIRAHSRGRLADLLEEFERNAVARGAKVHWAADVFVH